MKKNYGTQHKTAPFAGSFGLSAASRLRFDRPDLPGGQNQRNLLPAHQPQQHTHPLAPRQTGIEDRFVSFERSGFDPNRFAVPQILEKLTACGIDLLDAALEGGDQSIRDQGRPRVKADEAV